MTTPMEHPGIRVMRPLERDTHRESVLVHLAGEPGRPAVLARALDATGERMRRTELVALERARGDGVVGLIDVVDDEHGPSMLLDHHAGPRLTELLDARVEWTAGEAVAVLGPLVAAVARMHRAGVAGAGVSADRIVLEDGRPVLLDLGGAEVFVAGSPEAVLSTIDAVDRDRGACRELAIDVLGRVRGSRATAAAELMRALEAARAADVVPALEGGLRELAAPVAPRIHAASPPLAAPRARLVAVVPDATVADGATTGRMTEIGRAFALRLERFAPARRRLIVGGGAAVVVAGVLLAAIPPGTSSPAALPSPTPARSAGEHGGNAIEEGVLRGDDPVSAAVVLLEMRAGCFAELSPSCLDGVDQAGSSALVRDRAAIQALRDGRESSGVGLPDASAARLVQRLGDSALVALGSETAPASLLVMRGEAGWRIRDWIAEVD